MESAISSLTLRKLIEEIKPEIEGKYLNKVQQLNKDLYRFRFNPKSKDLLIEPGKRMNITKYRIQAPKKAMQSSMVFRKHLSNTRLEEIKQIGFDRVVEMSFSNEKKVIAELFGDGNLILLNENQEIIYAHRRGEWKHRKIIKNSEYKYPPSDTENPYEITFKEFKESFKEKKDGKINIGKKIVVNLAVDRGLGGNLAEYICKKSGVNKNKEEITEEEAKNIYESMIETLKKDSEPVKQNGEINPIPLKGEIEEKYESINQAVDENYTKEKDKKEEKGKKLKKLESRLEHQKRAIDNFKKQSKKEKKKGDMIYENYDKISKAVELFKSGKEGREKLKKHGVKIKDGKIVLELDQ